MKPIGLPIRPPNWITRESPFNRLIWCGLGLALGLTLVLLPLSSAGLLVVGAIALLVILIEPLAGLALTLLAGPFGALENVILGGSSFDSGQLLLLLTLASWLAHRVARGREWAAFWPPHHAGTARLAGLAGLMLVGWGAATLLWAPSITEGLQGLAKYGQIGLVAALAVSEGRRRGGSQAIGAMVLLSGLVQAAIGIWQFALRGQGPEHFQILGRFYRAYGTFEQPNPYAGFIGLILPLAAGWWVGRSVAVGGAVWSRRPGWPWWTVLKLALLGGAVGLMACAMLFSWSRGGWLGVGSALLAMLLFLPRRPWIGLALAAVLAASGWLTAASGFLPGSVAQRLTDFAAYVEFEDVRGVDVTPENYAVLERMAHWQAAINMANEHPWTGVGLGNYAVAYAQHTLLNWPDALGHAHNYYLNALAETGVPGLALYLAFWGLVMWHTARLLRWVGYPQRGMVLGLLGAWVHLSVHSLVDNLYVNNVYLFLGALLGMLVLVHHESAPAAGPGPARPI